MSGSAPRCHCTSLRRITRRVGALYDAVLAPLGINIAQYSLLRRIAAQGPISLTALGRVLELDRSTVGRNVRVLERLALVAMRPGEQDQRQTMISLSAAGEALMKRARPLWEKGQRAVEERLGAERIRVLEEWLAES